MVIDTVDTHIAVSAGRDMQETVLTGPGECASFCMWWCGLGVDTARFR